MQRLPARGSPPRRANSCVVNWPHSLADLEWAIGEAIILPLLFWELYRLRRSQRRDRVAKREAGKASGDSGPS